MEVTKPLRLKHIKSRSRGFIGIQVFLGAICIQEGRLSDTIVYVVGDEIREGGVGGNGWVGVRCGGSCGLKVVVAACTCIVRAKFIIHVQGLGL